MNGEDTTLADDEYVQEFSLDHFENVSIKPEIIATNAVGDGNVANDDTVPTTALTPASSSGLGIPPDDELIMRHSHTGDNVVISHHPMQHRLPPMPLSIPSPLHHVNAQDSPTDHLLTPPDNLADHYTHTTLLPPPPPLHHHHHHHYHQMMAGNMAMNGVKTTNLTMYPNIPGTPPDTPPVSNSPSPPQATYHHLEHHHLHPQEQYPQLQPLHHHPHLHQKGVGCEDEMFWLSPQSMNLRPRQEPLDLRPNCNGDSIQSWNGIQQQASVITGIGKRIFHAEYVNLQHHPLPTTHRQQNGPLQPLSPLLATSSISSSSSASSASSPLSSASSSLSSTLSSSTTTTTTTTTKALGPLPNGLVLPANSSGIRVGNSSSCRSGSTVSRHNAISVAKMYVGPPSTEIETVTPSPSGSNKYHSNGKHAVTINGHDIDIDDEMLIALSVRDLNARLKGSPKDKQLIIKQRRRTLKNRGYARNCRNKRVVQREGLESTNHKLQHDLSIEKIRNLNLQREVSRLQNENTKLQNEISRLHNEISNEKRRR